MTGVSDTISRRRVFSCRPTTVLEEEPCAARILKDLTAVPIAARARRRAHPTRCASTSRAGAPAISRKGIRLALQSILVSPLFVFRLERAAGHRGAADAPYRVADEDLASRLSFFLWGSGPDAPLVAAAQAGQLRTSAQIEAQVRRMLTDRRAEALATRFASQWLRLQDLDALRPEFTEYPLFDESLRDAMRRETAAVLRQHRPRGSQRPRPADAPTTRSSTSGWPATTASPTSTGRRSRRVTLPPYRRGLLGQASILTLTSVANRTSPVLRGKWVMEVLLGTPPPPPPPDVPALDESVTASAAGKFLTTRQRMEEHRKSPACSSCHRVIDPLGLALDNFDVTGAWRTKENQVAVDSEGVLYDGTSMEGPAGLQAALLAHSDMVLRSFTENLMTYALGRRLEYTDMPAVRAVVNGAAKADHRLSAYVLGVVNSQAFRMSTSEGSRAVTTAAGQQ